MKKRFLSIIIFAIFFLLILSVKSHANSINSINMKINIDKNGNAKVEEEWDATLSQGTEGYRAFKNSKYSDISISDFSVETDNGKEFTTLSSWNTSASFDSKSYKCGIHKISNGVELCWGISKYGTNKYILKYTINNFVSQYTDNQGIYLNLINLDQAVGEAKITISSDVAEFSLDNSRIWGFGYEGDIVFSDGDIVMNSDGRLNSSSYMVALVRFEEPLFNISKTSKYSFDEIYDTATENVDMKKHNTDIINGFNDTVTNVGIFFFGIIGINVLLFLLIIGRVSHRMKYIDKEIVKFEKGKHISNSETELWREIPCDNNLSLSYWVATTYKIEKKETLKRGLIGAILLKWINENRIEVKKNKKGLFNLRDNKYSIFLSTISEPTDSTEYSLYRIIKNAAGKNNILEPNELKRYCSINYTVLDSFFYSTLSNMKFLSLTVPPEDKLFYHFEKNNNASITSTAGQVFVTINELKQENLSLRDIIIDVQERINELKEKVKSIEIDCSGDILNQIKNLEKKLQVFVVESKTESFKLIKEVANLKKEKNELANQIQLAFNKVERIEKELGKNKKRLNKLNMNVNKQNVNNDKTFMETKSFNNTLGTNKEKVQTETNL